MALAGSAFIHQNHVVVLGIAPLDRQSRQFRRRFTRTASHVEDRPLVRMWVTRRNEDDLQRQSRESGARTQVGDGSVVHRSDPREEETVQEQMVGDPAALDGSHEALSLLPFSQYFQIVVELAQLALGQLTAEDYAGVLHELRA